MRASRKRPLRGFSIGIASSVAALLVQLFVPTLHDAAERLEGRASLVARAGAAGASAVEDGSAPRPGHDAAACAACRMLRHAGHGLLSAGPGMEHSLADSGRCAFSPPGPPLEVALASRSSRGPPSPLS